jgi:hypothetical protein
MGCGTLLENFTIMVITGSEGDRLVACRETLMAESVIVMSLDEGTELLSGRADEKDHSSSSAAGAVMDGGT